MPPEQGATSGAPFKNPSGRPGLTIERYSIEGTLGAGGMGEVFQGVHVVTQRRCALKLLPEQLCRDPSFVTRFHGEAKTLARLNHPHIVQLYTGGESGGRYFLEMEYVDGGDLLHRVLKYLELTGTGLPEPEVRRVTDAVLSALEFAHGQGIVHRDLKPANILLSKAGNVKVSDFGLAAVVGEDVHRTMVQESISLSKVASMDTTANLSGATSSGFAGTILYMSPQALRCEPPDIRDDIFSLGVLVYFMFVGKTPSVNYTPVSRLRPEIGRGWDRFIATCLREERQDRFINAQAARKALPPARRALRARTSLIGVAVALCLCVATYVWWFPGLPPFRAAQVEGQTITFEPIADVPAGARELPLRARASSELPVQFTVVRGPAEISANTISVTGPGEVVVRATQPGNSRFEPAAAVERSFRVLEPGTGAALKPQTIAFEPISGLKPGDLSIELAASASSGLPVEFKVAQGPASIAGRRLLVRAPGKIVVRAEQPGDANFQAAPPIERAIDVPDTIPAALKLVLPTGVEMAFVRVPAGTATLGSPHTEVGRLPTEMLKEFVLAEGFLLGTTEVTQAQYKAVMSGASGPNANSASPSYFRSSPDLPVEQVNFKAASDFIQQLNARLREQGTRQWVASLPSEEEWEYACRAGTSAPFANGADVTGPATVSIAKIAVFGRSQTAPVGSLEPNAFGLYDMHGNVAEWTSSGTLRGGAFKDPATECRSAARLRSQENNIDSRFGLRVMLRPARPEGP